MYQYKAIVKRVIDGDTIEVETIDLGFHVRVHGQKFRLLGINAPETRGPDIEKGLLAKEFLKRAIEGKEVILHTQKPDAFGRWLAEVYKDDININKYMLNNGYAKEYKH